MYFRGLSSTPAAARFSRSVSATQPTATSSPLRVAGAANGLPVIRFDGTNDGLSFASRITTVRTVFWVIKETATTDGVRPLLGDNAAADFYAGAARHAGSWWTDWAAWVARHGGGQVPARIPGDGKLKPIEDAPGSYVAVRAQD